MSHNFCLALGCPHSCECLLQISGSPSAQRGKTVTRKGVGLLYKLSTVTLQTHGLNRGLHRRCRFLLWYECLHQGQHVRVKLPCRSVGNCSHFMRNVYPSVGHFLAPLLCQCFRLFVILPHKEAVELLHKDWSHLCDAVVNTAACFYAPYPPHITESAYIQYERPFPFCDYVGFTSWSGLNNSGSVFMHDFRVAKESRQRSNEETGWTNRSYPN